MATAHATYHYEPEGWWIDCPEYPGYVAFAPTRAEATVLAREGLPFFAQDDDLDLVGLDTPTPVSAVDVVVPSDERPAFVFSGVALVRKAVFGPDTEAKHPDDFVMA